MQESPATARTLPIGAELVVGPDGERGVDLRVWAPTHERVTLVTERAEVGLERESSGQHHHAFVPGMTAGTRYRFRLGESADLLCDPASRYQPEGPFGPSEIIDPHTFRWTDAGWRGIERHAHVLYELHIGTFTPAGTWAAAAEDLPFLADLGITTIEVMPVNECAGTHNWGYDGVDLFAPQHTYGTPDDFRRFIDRAHACGMGVILDVVYNHFGPNGNQLFTWSPHFRSDRRGDWGDTLAFDGPHSAGVREFFLANARYWITEFHLDGLRVDATQAIHDESPEHFLTALVREARAAAPDRSLFLVAENEPQDASLLADAVGFDALWNDDFHHTSRVALTGLCEGYLHDYHGTPQELLSAIKRGFLYQGQIYAWQQNPRGTPTRGLARHRFVQFLENHDQVANLGYGERLPDLANAAAYRAMTALLCLTPALPMLFQGQECGSRAPWHFFVDHGEDLHEPIRKGRAAFMAQFARMATPEAQAALPDPALEETFRRCILDPALRTVANPVVRLHRDLLRLRREDPAFTDPREGALDGAILERGVLALRFFQDDPIGDRLILWNPGRTVSQTVSPEPLIAAPAGFGWRVKWSSEDPAYGGHGTPTPMQRARITLPAYSALVLEPDRGSVFRHDDTVISGDQDPTRIVP